MVGLTACSATGLTDGGQSNSPGAVDDGTKTIEELRADSLAAIDSDACAQAGGTVRQEGLLGMFRCVLPYSDAGKQCRDVSDCEGRCFAQDGVTNFDSQPGDFIGVCEADDSPFGCFGEITDGTLDGMLCVD